MGELHIIMPVTRPTNIAAIYHDLNSHSAHVRQTLQLNWWPIFDKICGEQAHDWKVRFSRNRNDSFSINPIISDKSMVNGFVHRNTVLDILEENTETMDIGAQWIYHMDDDNILHPNFLYRLLDALEVDVFLGNQECLNGSTRFVASWEAVQAGNVDLAQMAFRIKALKGYRFNEANAQPAVQFVQSICNSNKTRTAFINEYISYHNFLR